MDSYEKVKELIKRLKSITVERQIDEIRKSVKRHRKLIISFNTGQLLLGETSKGKSLGKYKSKSYEEFKAKLNPRRVVDLKLTGHFHGNFFIVDEYPLIIWSYDAKTDDLVKKYGEEIFGLTEENKDTFVEGYLKEDLLKYYRKVLQL